MDVPKLAPGSSMSSAKYEMESLWRAVFGEPPPIDAEAGLLAQFILRFSTTPPVYDLGAPQRPEEPSSPA